MKSFSKYEIAKRLGRNCAKDWLINATTRSKVTVAGFDFSIRLSKDKRVGVTIENA